MQQQGSGGRVVSLNDGREYRLSVVPFGFGRDAEAEVVVASPDASRRHAEIVVRPDGSVLVDLSTNGTYVNGSRIVGRRPLKALDVIRIGAEEFRYYSTVNDPVGRVVPPAGAAARLSDTLVGLPRVRPLATLRIKSGAAKGDRLLVVGPISHLGRGAASDIRISDPSVSAEHAMLELREGVWTLTDLGSGRGSEVDGVPVTEETPLSPGATIRLGEVLISFEPNDERADVAPRPPALPRSAPAAVSAPNVASPPVEPAVASGPRVGLMAAAIALLLAALVALVLFV